MKVWRVACIFVQILIVNGSSSGQGEGEVFVPGAVPAGELVAGHGEKTVIDGVDPVG